ncbi:MAG TPA: PKD domain-containing protein [Planctomycetota bacterium]|jgi:PKD repeat protein
MRLSRLTLPLGVLFVFALLLPVSGLTLRRTNWGQLVGGSDCVVAGTVYSVRAEATAEPGMHGVQTRMHLNEVQALSGKKVADELDVILAGGSIPERTVLVPGEPRFVPGEKLVLLLRDVENGEFALTGHAMGVLRRSADGKTVRPDLAVEGGPAAAGESYDAFVKRLGGDLNELALNAPSPLTPLPRGGEGDRGGTLVRLGGLALLLLAVVLLRRRKYRSMAAVVLAGSGLLMLPGTRTSAQSSTAGVFVLEGVSWDLSTPQIGRVIDGKVLWVRGQPSVHVPADDSFNVITQNFQQWSTIAGCAILYAQDGKTIASGTAVDTRTVVSFLLNGPRKTFDANTLAITFIIPDQTNPANIFDADIVLNDNQPDWTVNQGDVSVAAVSLHEMGHLTGLDHTNNPETVMYPVSQGLTVLSQGELDGARKLYPIDSVPPSVLLSASPLFGAAPLDVSFSSDGSAIFGSGTPAFSWDFGDGSAISSNANPVHTYTATGTFTAKLTVSDPRGQSNSDTIPIVVTDAKASATVQKFSFSGTLALTGRGKPNDKLSLMVSGINAQPSDLLTVEVGPLPLAAASTIHPQTTFPLDSRGSFKGTASIGGTLSVKVSRGVLTLSLTGGSFAPFMDPNWPDTTSETGSVTIPVDVVVQRPGGGTTDFSTKATYNFTIKAGKTPLGLAEKTIQGKM